MESNRVSRTHSNTYMHMLAILFADYAMLFLGEFVCMS